MIGSYTSKNLHTEHLCLTTGEESRNPSELFKYFNHTQKELGSQNGEKCQHVGRSHLSYVQDHRD